MAEIRFLVHLIVIFQGTSQRSYRDTAIILDIGHYLYRTKNESLLKITVGNGRRLSGVRDRLLLKNFKPPPSESVRHPLRKNPSVRRPLGRKLIGPPSDLVFMAARRTD